MKGEVFVLPLIDDIIQITLVLELKRGCSLAGRAPPLHGGGREFESPQLHQIDQRFSYKVFTKVCERFAREVPRLQSFRDKLQKY